MKELKSGDKIVQQMTRDGAVEVNKAKIGDTIDRLQTERRVARKKAVRKANKKIYDSIQQKPETARLKFTDAERGKPPNGKLTHIFERPGHETALAVHREISKSENDNSGVQAAHFSEKTAESAARKIGEAHSRLKFEPQHQTLKAEEKTINANVNEIYKRDLQTKPELEKASASQKVAYKRQLKKDYTRAFRHGDFEGVKKTAEKAKNAAKKAGEKAQQTAKSAAKNGKWIISIGGLLGLIILLSAGVSSCLSMCGGGNAVIGTSYTAENEDILGADADYTALENELWDKINSIPGSYPGYDEYNYALDTIEHDPFELTSYLTAKYNAYTRAGVQAELAALIAAQYTLTVTPVTEIRYRTEYRTGYYTDTDGNMQSYTYPVQVPYYYYILNISLVNHGVGSVALSSLTPEQYEMYLVYMETKGNKPELFS